MGRVYLARSEGGRTLAVKAVHREHLAKPRFRARFRREIEAARRVGDRWTAPVIDADPDAAQPWVATGYVPGTGLDAVVKEFGPLPAASVRALADGLLRALRGIHAAGIVHRDLKPSNVLLTVAGPRVIDFGIAYALEPTDDSPLTSTGTTVGSPGFMAPEQILGEEPGPAADVFALGGVLVYAATGRLPFGHGASNQHAVLYRIVESDPDLSDIDDAALRTFIEHTLTKDVDERPGVDALLDDLAAETEERDAADTGDTRDTAGAAGPWLPPRVVAHLAQQSARLLDVEAVPAGEGTAGDTPVTGHAPAPAPSSASSSVSASASASASVPASGDGAATTTAEPRQRKRPSGRLWAVAGAVLAVVAAGGTFALLDRDGDARADSRTPHSASPDSGGAASAGGAGGRDADDGTVSGKSRDAEDGARGADGKDGEDGKDASGGDGEKDGGKGSGDKGSGGGTGGGDEGGDGGGSGGGSPSDKVPERFVGSWKMSGFPTGSAPTDIRIYRAGPGELAARLVIGGPGPTCESTARLTGTADGGKRVNIGTTTPGKSNIPGYCQKADPSYFTLDSSSVLRYHPATYDAGYTYNRG